MKNITKATVNFIHGVVMGIAEIVPGISASTATLLLGIYDDFIDLLAGLTNFVHVLLQFILRKQNFSKVKTAFKEINFAYGIQLLAGMSIGIVVFSNIISFVYDRDEQLMNSIFFGIILVSLIIPLKIVKKPKFSDLIFLLIGFFVFFSILNLNSGVDSDEVPLWLVFLGGSISVTGMVLPGVNSSFLLIPLGVYEVILNIITQMSRLNFQAEYIVQTITFFVGLGVGLVTIVKILKIAFEKYVTNLFSLIAGIMIASLAELWPFASQFGERSIITPLVTIIISCVITYIFIKISKPEKEFASSK